MKKNRPAYKLSVLTHKSQLQKVETILFEDTTSFGLRYFPLTCHRLARRFQKVETKWGTVAVKIGIHKGEVVQVSPEFEDCKKLAQQHDIPLNKIYTDAILNYRNEVVDVLEVPNGKMAPPK